MANPACIALGNHLRRREAKFAKCAKVRLPFQGRHGADDLASSIYWSDRTVHVLSILAMSKGSLQSMRVDLRVTADGYRRQLSS
jgi:hypothetical protein